MNKEKKGKSIVPILQSQILLYTTENGKTKIEVKLENKTVWITQMQMADLFQTTKQNISDHIKNIYESSELEQIGTVKDFLTVQKEGSRKVQRTIQLYNLDVIISVGYRVNSHRGIQFRKWATDKLNQYLTKGFAMDDERLSGEKVSYFDELQERVRAIRNSEKNFWNRITDVFTTSIDYDCHSEVAKIFFATVQNKFHFAIHGHTAQELIIERADATKENMGLMTWKGSTITTHDVTVAKNYLHEDELKRMNLLSDQFLSFAELQAVEKRPMYMRDWITKMHGFFILNEKAILLDSGTVSKEIGHAHAIAELHKYEQKRKELIRQLNKLSTEQNITDESLSYEVNYEITKKKITPFDKQLKGLLNVPPKKNIETDF